MTSPRSEALVPVGHFDDYFSETPAFDPGLGVPCPVCGERLDSQPSRVTISFAPMDQSRSLFFRAHRACWERDPNESARIEGLIVESELGGRQ